MNLDQNENQLMIAEMLKSFALQHIKPYLNEWDEKQVFPVEVFRKLGELGVMGVLVPQKYGGAGFSYYEYVTSIVEIAKVCGGVGLSVAAHNSLGLNHILQFGNEEQKNKYIPKLAKGEHIAAWGLTEPNTGSDAGNMQTTAKKVGDNWVLNGTKNFITHGLSGDVAVVIARTGEPRSKNNSTAFIVERGFKGFRGGKKEDKKLEEHFQRLIARGTGFVSAERLEEVNLKITFKDKKENINGLQLADLVAYPIARYVIEPKRANPAFEKLEPKIYKKNEKRYGLKIFP